MTHTDILRIAELSRLQFNADEVAAFSSEFQSIINYVSAISAIPMDGVEPQATVNDSVNVMRDDVVGLCLSTADALSNAPKKNESFIKVPKVLG